MKGPGARRSQKPPPQCARALCHARTYPRCPRRMAGATVTGNPRQSASTWTGGTRCSGNRRSAGNALGPAGFGTIIGNTRLLRLKEGWEEGATIYASVVADPGDKKTSEVSYERREVTVDRVP